MILMNDFKAEPETLRQAQLEAAGRVLASGWYVLGKEVTSFEEAWAERCGLSHAVGVANGMDAIEIGLRASGIGLGDEIVTTPMTAFATVLAILRTGATPVMADINPETGLLDINSVRRCLTRQTRGILLVHLYGQVREIDAWQSFCQEHGLKLFEDCAQAHEAAWNGRRAGSFGTFGAYSFYPTKNLGAPGDGGALVTDSDKLAQQARVLRNYGQSQRYHHPEVGLNSRLDEIHAAMLTERLKWLTEFTDRRREVASKYFSGIQHPQVRLLTRPVAAENHVYHLFVVSCPERDRLGAYLKEKGIDNLSHYPIPIHHQPPCKEIQIDPQGLQHAEAHAQTCLSIPCHPQLSDADVAYVIETINAFR